MYADLWTIIKLLCLIESSLHQQNFVPGHAASKLGLATILNPCFLYI